MRCVYCRISCYVLAIAAIWHVRVHGYLLLYELVIHYLHLVRWNAVHMDPKAIDTFSIKNFKESKKRNSTRNHFWQQQQPNQLVSMGKHDETVQMDKQLEPAHRCKIGVRIS